MSRVSATEDGRTPRERAAALRTTLESLARLPCVVGAEWFQYFDHPRLDASAGIPRAPRDPFANFVATQTLRHWDRERGFVKPASEFPIADLYVCWSPKAIYLGLYGFDIIEDGYYRNKSVPKDERALWTVTVRDGEAIRARIGAGREAIVNDPSVRLENLSGSNLNVRNVAIVELPAERFGKERLRAGDTIDLNTTLLTHAQAYRVEWNGTFKLTD